MCFTAFTRFQAEGVADEASDGWLGDADASHVDGRERYCLIMHAATRANVSDSFRRFGRSPFLSSGTIGVRSMLNFASRICLRTAMSRVMHRAAWHREIPSFLLLVPARALSSRIDFT